MSGKLLMIPCPIVENNIESLASSTIDAIHNTRYYVTERARTCRRFIKKTNPPYQIQELTILEMDKNNPGTHINQVMQWLKDGMNVGVVSESGCPGIADPGSLYSDAAHKNNFEVHPFVGPTSIILALMAAGMNGQNFAFVGYLPIKGPELKSRIKQLERLIIQQGQTQIFIETPYRNNKLLASLCSTLSDQIKLCVAIDITAPESLIKTKTIKAWKQDPPTIGKQNTIFILGK